MKKRPTVEQPNLRRELKAYRNRRGATWYAIEREAGVSRGLLAKIARGEKSCGMLTFERINPLVNFSDSARQEACEAEANHFRSRRTRLSSYDPLPWVKTRDKFKANPTWAQVAW